MKTIKYNKGVSTVAILVLIAVVVVAGVIVYFVGSRNKNGPGYVSVIATTTNPCVQGTTHDANGNATTTLCRGEVDVTPPASSNAFNFNGNCDWSAVHTITQFSSSVPGKVAFTMDYSNGKVLSKNGLDLSAILGLLCNTAALSSYQSYYNNGGNTNGQWFAAGPGEININRTTFAGQDVFTLENRSVSKVNPGHIYVSQMIVSAKTFLRLGGVTDFAPGTDLQLSKSISQILRAPTLMYSYQ
jgi:uncharacterized protein (UPF0333 family)